MTQHLLVQTYLRTAGNDLATLLRDHGVKGTPHNGKVSLAYDQLAARNSDPLACQCRGLIVREGSWEIVAYPFNRFFNQGQGEAAIIDWETARFEEKLDGTLLIVYWDALANRWLCGTRNMCEAQGNINGAGSFADLADRAAVALGVGASGLHSLMDGGIGADRGVTYMMELTGPYNTIVCQYRELGLTLLGARRLDTHEEIDVSGDESLGLRGPRTWHFADLTQLAEVIKSWDPREFEGVVIKDAHFNRIKVKSPAYVAAAHASESLGNSWRAVCEAILTGIADDLIGIVPPLVEDRISRLKPAIAAVVARTETDFAEISTIDDMNTFAFAAKEKLWPAGLFSVKRGKAASVSAFAEQAGADSVLEMCERVAPGVTQ